MSEHILFLTGKLAEPSLHRVLAEMDAEFSYDVHQLGISVAGLMTADMIRRRLTDIRDADRVVVPGRCRGDLMPLGEQFSTSFERGPDELKDLPRYFGKQAKPPDLSRYDVQIFAEIVDAPSLSVDQILVRAGEYRRDGADVIDLGCLPDTPFPHLGESVEALKGSDFRVSIDSLDPDDLLRGGRAGADYLLSLTADTLWVAEEVDAVPVLIPRSPGDTGSLEQAIEAMTARGVPFVADSILDPIHFGFTESITRYHQLRKRYPDMEIIMGTGNLTELTEADTTGITALLLGIVSELRIGHVLVTQVSPHCISAVREADRARRIMHYAREQGSLPKQIDGGLTTTHERNPFPYSRGEIQQLAEAIRDPSFRIQVSNEGIHLYNRDGLETAVDPYEIYPRLGVENDAGHAFYLGVELARAQIAWQLGKRYVQDEELDWGCAVPRHQEDRSRYRSAGVTMTQPTRTKDKS